MSIIQCNTTQCGSYLIIILYMNNSCEFCKICAQPKYAYDINT